jgi:N-acetylglucosaminyl-diphospho-decaprenol L-rhamnosyltransferase
MPGYEVETPTHQPDGADRRMVSAIVVTYFTGPVFCACLDSMLAQSRLLELIVIVNGAEQDVRTDLKKRAEIDQRIRLVEPDRNMGFAPACNLGAAMARGDHLAFINPDCNLMPGTFAAVLDVFARNPNAWLVGGRLQNPDGREQRGGRREFLTPWRALVEAARLDRLFPHHPYFRRFNLVDEPALLEPVVVPVVSGAFMMIKRSSFERLGGMDDNFFLHLDDTDLCLRIHLQGGEVWYAGNVPITHHRSTSDASRLFIEWHKTRSACYYFRKHFQRSYPVWSLSMLSAVLWVRFLLVALKALLSDLRVVSKAQAPRVTTPTLFKHLPPPGRP